MRVLKQSESTASLRRVFFMLVDAPTGAIPQTSKAATLTGYLTKKGATAAALTGSFTEVDVVNIPGLYHYEVAVAELDTVGRLVFEFTCVACLTRVIVTHVGAVLEDVKAEVDTHPTAVEVDTQLSGTHGAGAWGTESVGVSPLTVTVTDSVTIDPVSGVVVHVRDAAGDVLYDWGVTDANGQVGMLLSDGSYGIWCSKVSSYSFTNPTTVTVSGATSKAITGTPFSPTTPVSPDLCTVYGWTLDEQGSAISVTVKAELVADQRFMTDGPQIVKQAVTQSSGASDGYWEIALTRSAEYAATGVTYRFTVDDRFVGEFTVPNQATVGLKELSTS